MKRENRLLLLLLVLIASIAVFGCEDLIDALQDTEEDPTAPEPPSNLTVIAYNNGLQIAWWDNSDDEEGFRIEQQPEFGNWSMIAEVGANTYSYYWQPPSFGEPMNFRVLAFSGDMESEYSNVYNFTVDAQTPSNLAINQHGDDWVELFWQDPSNAETGYAIEQSLDNGANWTEVSQTGPNSTNYTVEGLSLGVEYSFRVKALYGTVSSDYSNIVTYTAAVPMPNNFSLNGYDETWATFTWESPSVNRTGYRIEISMDYGSTYTERAIVGSAETSWTEYLLVVGVPHTYRIITLVDGAESEPTSGVLVESYLHAPTDLSAQLTTDTGTPNVILNWQDNSGAEEGYTVQRRTDGTGWATIGSIGANNTQARDTNPSPGENNYYRLFAYTENTESYFSNEAYVYVTAPTFNIAASTSFEGMNTGFFPLNSGGLTWTVIDRNDQGVGVFVVDNPVYEGSRSAAIVDYSTFYADVMMGHAQLSGLVRTQMKVYCQDTDKVGNFVGIDGSGNELFRISFWWSNGTFQYYDGTNWVDTNINFPTGEWFDMTIDANTSNNTWSFYVNGNAVIDGMDYLVTGDGYYTGTLIRLNPNSYMSTPIIIDNVEVGTVTVQ